MIEIGKEITNLNEIKQLLLEILLYIDRICFSNNLRYSLAYGTLIGAIRHNGFIPWDDDVDIYMPREDFNKFCAIVLCDINKRYKIASIDQKRNYDSVIYKVYDDRTLLVQKTAGSQNNVLGKPKYTIGVYVDIFVLDHIPDDANKLKWEIRKTTLLQKAWGFSYSTPRQHNIWVIKVLREIANKTNLALLFAKIIDNNSKKCDAENKDSIFLGNLLNVGSRVVDDKIPNSYFDNCIDVRFENHKFKAIPNYDEVLRNWYGDYMKMPPIQEQISNHTYCAYYIE